MSIDGEYLAHDEFYDSTEHQTAFVFAPGRIEDVSTRPAKRRKTVKPTLQAPKHAVPTRLNGFEPKLNKVEAPESMKQRQDLFERTWAETDANIQSVLHEANEGTLAEVIAFVENPSQSVHGPRLPAGFIVTGPNISSQALLFNQLAESLKTKDKGPVVLLRAGDALNLKNALKLIIRDSTNQGDMLDDEEVSVQDEFGRKFLNYDLEILQKYVNGHGIEKVVVILQDSEAFDSDLLAELIQLFSSWLDRIPFVLLLGVATSVALFHDRLPRAASRCLDGIKFDVENTSIILSKIFKKTLANVNTPVRLGPTLVSALMERQKDHVQSVQTFTMALKYAYMCHFYGNALSILTDTDEALNMIQDIHFEATRMLPSFRTLIEETIEQGNSTLVKSLLDDDQVLLAAIKSHRSQGKSHFENLLGVIHLLSVISPEPVHFVDLYVSALKGTLDTSESAQKVLEGIKNKPPQEISDFIQQIISILETGSTEMDLVGRDNENSEILSSFRAFSEQLTTLTDTSQKTGDPLRSANAILSKGLRTTVIAQRVQLTHEKSKLSKQDQAFTTLVNELCDTLKNLFSCKSPTSIFLHEAWLYDSQSPYEEVFTPRPRHAIETALTSPHERLQCACCKSDEGLSAAQPATAILYQMCLQAGSLINIADLWSTFLDNQNQNDDEEFDEREALVKFYQALSDLKQLGVVKQSKKKVDHLAKVLWKGL